MECVQDNGLVWYITDEVVSGKLQESTLDQVLSTNEAIVNEVMIVSPLGKSDHVCFNVELNLSLSNSKQDDEAAKEPRKLWGKVSGKELLHRSAEIDWSFSEGTLTSEDMWSELKKNNNNNI